MSNSGNLLDRIDPDDIADLRDRYSDILDRDERVETPIDPFDRLVLNPGADEKAGNPLCPDCEEPIEPWANQYERRFRCGCDGLKRFSFDRGGDNE